MKPDLLLSNEESIVLRHLQQSSHSLTPHQQSELERLQFGLFTVDYLKKNGKNHENNSVEPMETNQFETNDQPTDYGMEVSAIRGRRTPGLCSPTEFSHLVTASELIR